MQFGIAGEDQPGVVAGDFQQVGMGLDAGDLEARRAGLARAQQLAFAAQLQVFLGDEEAVLGLAHDRQPALGGFAERVLVEQHAGRRLRAAPDAAAQLVQLGQAEALGMLDDHDGGVRHVDADLDDGGGDEDARLAVLEGAHGLVLLRPLHAAVDETEPRRRTPAPARRSGPPPTSA